MPLQLCQPRELPNHNSRPTPPLPSKPAAPAEVTSVPGMSVKVRTWIQRRSSRCSDRVRGFPQVRGFPSTAVASCLAALRASAFRCSWHCKHIRHQRGVSYVVQVLVHRASDRPRAAQVSDLI
jgi:hypothetical protein